MKTTFPRGTSGSAEMSDVIEPAAPSAPPSSALATILPTNLVSAFAKVGGIEAIVAAVEAEARAQAATLDVTKPKDRKAMASLAYKISQSKVILDDTGADLGEAARKTVSAINADRKLGRDRMEALRDEVLAPIKAFDQREKDRVAAHEQAIADLAAMAQVEGLSSDQIKARLWAVPDPDGRDWQEFQAKAGTAYMATMQALQTAYDAAIAVEAAEIETERLRLVEVERIDAENEAKRIEREAQIARDAAAVATMEAELRAENERNAAAKALADAEANTARIAAEAERARVAAAERAKTEAAVAVERERDRVAAEEARKKADDEVRTRNVAHQKVVNNEVLVDLMATLAPLPVGFADEDLCKAIITALAKREIRHCQINY